MKVTAPAPRVVRCRTCDAAIVWAVTASGARMPVDAEPVRQPGDFVLVPDPDHPDAPIARPAPAIYVSHFATCPDASQHRKR